METAGNTTAYFYCREQLAGAKFHNQVPHGFSSEKATGCSGSKPETPLQMRNTTNSTEARLRVAQVSRKRHLPCATGMHSMKHKTV